MACSIECHKTLNPRIETKNGELKLDERASQVFQNQTLVGCQTEKHQSGNPTLNINYIYKALLTINNQGSKARNGKREDYTGKDQRKSEVIELDSIPSASEASRRRWSI